jgi:hypothetical protein
VNLATDESTASDAPVGSAGRLRVRVKRGLSIQRDPMELYSFWLDTLAPEGSSADGPAPLPEAVVTKTVPGQLISWSIADAESGPHTGTVRFEPAVGNQGTEVSVVLEFYSPGGKLADARVKYSSREAADRLVAGLCSLKRVMEGEEIPTVAAATEKVPQLRSDPLVTGLKLRIGRLETPISNMMEDMLPQWMGGTSTTVEP